MTWRHIDITALDEAQRRRGNVVRGVGENTKNSMGVGSVESYLYTFSVAPSAVSESTLTGDACGLGYQHRRAYEAVYCCRHCLMSMYSRHELPSDGAGSYYYTHKFPAESSKDSHTHLSLVPLLSRTTHCFVTPWILSQHRRLIHTGIVPATYIIETSFGQFNAGGHLCFTFITKHRMRL